MARTKHERTQKQQLGQFLTPDPIAGRLLEKHELTATDKVLEPGFGSGAFLVPLIDAFMALRDGNLEAVLNENVWGIELDDELYEGTLGRIEEKWGPLPEVHNLRHGDFLLEDYQDGELTFKGVDLFSRDGFFDLIIGNPPFGGTVNVKHQNALEKRFGRRQGMKIKKETYSFFLVKSLDLIKTGGTIEFICSDTFLTIATMKGLRKSLMDEGRPEVLRLDEFSPETSYPMVVIHFVKGPASDVVLVDHDLVARDAIEATANLSWQAGGEWGKYFGASVLGNYVVASGGMTTGKNEYFVRHIDASGFILEPLDFDYFDDPMTLERELQRARLGQLSESMKSKHRAQESAKETRRNLRVVEKAFPERIPLPHADYRLYNKAQKGIVFTRPQHAIFWKDEGDAVLTYKKNGNWYLHGVGGAPFFGREGMTWKLISAKLDTRFLPSGYILDSGAPCAFLREGVDKDELWFILGWTLTETASAILKNVLNHTMNIQGKDVEKLPYPWWVTEDRKQQAILCVRDLVKRALRGEIFDRKSADVVSLGALFEYRDLRAPEAIPGAVKVSVSEEDLLERV